MFSWRYKPSVMHIRCTRVIFKLTIGNTLEFVDTYFFFSPVLNNTMQTNPSSTSIGLHLLRRILF